MNDSMSATKELFQVKQSLTSKNILYGAIFNTIILTLTVIGISQVFALLFPIDSPTSLCGSDTVFKTNICDISYISYLFFTSAVAIILTGLLFKYIKINRPHWVAFANFILGWLAFLIVVAFISNSLGPLNAFTEIKGMLIAGIPVFYLAYFMINRFTFKMWLILLGAIMILGVIHDLISPYS